MQLQHEFLATAPVDLYALHLFQLVAEHRSFTRAAAIAGLTQSAVSRQIQGMERSLDIELFRRTTRRIQLTPAGEYLLREAARLNASVAQSLRTLAEDFKGARKQVRVGVSRTIAFAHLPGLFHANLRRLPEVGYHVSYQQSAEILAAVEAYQLDVGIVDAPVRLPAHLRATHRFEDAFTLVAATQVESMFGALAQAEKRQWLMQQSWLLLEGDTITGRELRRWLREQQLRIEPVMELDSFDLLLNLVALGMGISLVPIRALALFGRRRAVARLAFPDRFVRQLAVVVRKQARMPEHLTQFVENILF